MENLESIQIFQYQLKALNGPFTIVYFVVKPLIWSEAEGDYVVIGTTV